MTLTVLLRLCVFTAPAEVGWGARSGLELGFPSPRAVRPENAVRLGSGGPIPAEAGLVERALCCCWMVAFPGFILLDKLESAF